MESKVNEPTTGEIVAQLREHAKLEYEHFGSDIPTPYESIAADAGKGENP